MKTLADWESYLEALTPPSEIRLGLDRVAEVWSRLNLGVTARVLMVAGTNGKGSVVETAGALAKARGLRFGQYTSPHLLNVRERIRLDGEWISESALVNALGRVEQAREGVNLTYFEMLTLAAFVAFQSEVLDLWIVEIGLGGRLDAVNVLNPDVAVITHIGMDHQEFLGDTAEAIAREKAGIMRPGRVCLTAAMAVIETLQAVADEVGAKLHDLPTRCDADGVLVTSKGKVDVRKAQLPAESVGLAVAAMDELEYLPETPLTELIESIRVQGRMTERSIKGVRWVLDVGHNVDACRYVTDRLLQDSKAHPRVLIIGVLTDKDAEAMSRVWARYADRCVVVGLPGTRGRSADALAAAWKDTTGQTPWRTFATLTAALDALSSQFETGTEVLIMGSFILVADALRHEHFN